MAVVAVGDLPTPQLEELVAEAFGSLEGRGPEPARAPIVVEPDPAPRIETLAFAGLGASRVSLDLQFPVWPAGTVGGEQLRFAELLIVEMLEDRLVSEYHAGRLTQANEPYLVEFKSGAALRFYGTNLGASLTTPGSHLADATADFLSVTAGAAEYGFSADELERAVARVRDSLDAAADAETRQTQPSALYASSCVDHFLEGAYLASAEDRRDFYRQLLDTTTLEGLNQHWSWLWRIRVRPVLVPFGETEAAIPTVEEMNAALEAVQPRQAAAEPEPAVEELMAAPDPATPASEGGLDVFKDFETYEWRFGNGATVVFVESDLAPGQVSLRAQSLGGYSAGAPGEGGLRRMALDAVKASGLGELSPGQLSVYLDGSTAVAEPSISAAAQAVSSPFGWTFDGDRPGPSIREHTEGFNGAALTHDLEDVFALLHLYHAQPRVSDRGRDVAVSSAIDSFAYGEAYTPWILYQAYLSARHPDNPWQVRLASPDQIAAADAESLLELHESRFGGVDDLLVVVAGDADRAVVANLAARYVGSLPAGEADTFADRRSPQPAGVVSLKVPVADPYGAGVVIHYESYPVKPGSYLQYLVELLEVLMAGRIAEEFGGDDYRRSVPLSGLATQLKVSDELADTYVSPVRLDVRLAPEATVVWEFSYTGEADSVEQIHRRLLGVIDGTVRTGPTESEFADAKATLAARYADPDNSDLIDVLLRLSYVRDDSWWTAYSAGRDGQWLMTPSRLQSNDVTVEGVRDAAEIFFDSGQRIEIFALPAEHS